MTLRKRVEKTLEAIRDGQVHYQQAANWLAADLEETAPKRKVKLGPPRMDYTREELIEICEAAIVSMDQWHNRDSASAMRQVGDCWALLKANVPFRIQSDTDHDTIWIEHYDIRGFNAVEMGEEYNETEGSYLPTPKRLVDRTGGDWY